VIIIGVAAAKGFRVKAGEHYRKRHIYRNK